MTHRDRIGLTPIVTLEKLAAESKFASTEPAIPQDVMTRDIKITLNGHPFTRGVTEIYAPGDETGYAVVSASKKDGVPTEIVYGNFKFTWGDPE